MIDLVPVLEAEKNIVSCIKKDWGFGGGEDVGSWEMVMRDVVRDEGDGAHWLRIGTEGDERSEGYSKEPNEIFTYWG